MSVTDPTESKPGEPSEPREPDEHDPQPSTVPTEHGPDEAEDDVMSDPARDDRLGSDWADEGGSTPSGPATAAPTPDGAAERRPKHG